MVISLQHLLYNGGRDYMHYQLLYEETSSMFNLCEMFCFVWFGCLNHAKLWRQIIPNGGKEAALPFQMVYYYINICHNVTYRDFALDNALPYIDNKKITFYKPSITFS